MIKQFKGKYRFLSNFYPVHLIIDGKDYATTEHYFQSCKFKNPVISEKIRTASSPSLAKKLARKHASVVRGDWFDVSLEIMEKALRAKFKNPELKKMLLETGELELQEGNTWHDTFWGIDIKSGKGENHLGKILMKIRNELKLLI